MFSPQIYREIFVNHRYTGGFTYFALHIVHATFCIEPRTIGKVASIYLGKDYDVMYLENPIKAIDWLNEGNVPDLIISDIRMPLMRGDEFLRYMKANELFKSIPIVMLSSEESTTERIKLLEEGAEDYILKPFNPLELKIRIKKIID